MCLIRLFQKNQAGGIEDMRFPGVLRKQHVKILWFNYKRKEICWGDQEKIMLNSHGCWFLTMAWNLQKGCNTILWKFLGEALLCLELPRVKEKFPGFFSKKVCPHAPPLPQPIWIFSSPLYNFRCNSRSGLVEFV